MAYALFGVLAILKDGTEGSMLATGVGTIAVVGGTGVVLRKYWSVYVVLLASFFVVARLAYAGMSFVVQNVHSFEDLPLFWFLLPGALVTFAALACPYLVFRFFDDAPRNL